MSSAITEAMLRSGVFYYGNSTIEQGAGNYWIIRNKQGIVTHRIEPSVIGGTPIVRDISTGLTVSDATLSLL